MVNGLQEQSDQNESNVATNIDGLSQLNDIATATNSVPTTVAPLALVLGYGISRATASGMQEFRNTIFSTVAQDTIRKIGKSTFEHLHNLEYQFHVSEKIWEVLHVHLIEGIGVLVLY